MRKLTILTLALLYVVSLAAVSAFAANAAKAGETKAHMVPVESRNQPLTDNGTSTPSTIGSGKSDESYQALGYRMTGISPGIELGTTSYDLQHNMRMARQIAVGANGRVHMMWTNGGPLPFDAGNRVVNYQTYLNGVISLPEVANVSGDLEKTPGRFGTVDVYADRALIVNHWGAGITTSVLDLSSGGGNFGAASSIDMPWSLDLPNCENIHTGTPAANYGWPVVSADQDGTGKLVIHIAASELNTAGGSWSVMNYYRGVGANLSMPMAAGMYGTCGKFIDSVQATGYDIAASPYSDEVVIAYPKAREGNRENNDLAYVRSTDMGLTWGPGGTVAIIDVTQFATGAKERVAGDMSVLFTSDGFFHIIYVGNIYDSVASTVSDQQAKLYHWSSQQPTKRSMVLDANNEDANCNTPAFEYNTCKVNLTQCYSTPLAKTLLYAVYSRQLGTTLVQDCSDLEYFNQEVFISASSTWGETWGAPINLTNTNTNGCVGPNCADDGSSSSAKYVTDSLRIEFMEDLDAGSNVGNEGGSGSYLNPIKFLSYPCVDMAPYRILTCTPSSIEYPFHAVVGATATQELLLVNGGNQSINWTSSLVGGNCPVSLPGSGTVTAGYDNSATITATVGPKATEGLFTTTIRFTYEAGTVDVPVDFYVFNSWFLPQDVPLRTSTNRMLVNQAGQAASDVSKSSFSYFEDLSEDFITDASLILGNSADNLSWLIFKSGQGGATESNNFGKLYALSNTIIDSTTYATYRIASGKGTNRDSTVAFGVNWYAAKWVDSADFYVGHFEIYKGTKWTANVAGLDIAFATDFDVPSDTGSDNVCGTDPDRQMVYLQGMYSADRQNGFGALAAYRKDAVPITGGFAFGNPEQVYPTGGLHVDSVWKYMELTNNSYTSYKLDSATDQSIVMVIAKNYTVTASSRLKFDVVLAGKRAQNNGFRAAGLDGLRTAVDQAKNFITGTVCTECGDANNDGSVDISDAVYLIAHIFSGGTAPLKCGYNKGRGDANADGSVDISDVVFLIARIFSGGAPPRCQNQVSAA